MAINLGERIKNECAGIYYGGKAEHVMANRSNTFFGVENRSIVDMCSPRSIIPKFSLKYWTLPKELRQVITDPDGSGSDLMKGDNLIFFHYGLNRSKYEKEAQKGFANVDFDSEEFRRVFGERDQQNSCIYTNFLGETIYAGNMDLIQQVTNHLKGGFTNVFDIASKLVGKDVAQTEIKSFNELHVFDAVGKPKYVHHRK